jgi:hypothetical protein
LLRRKSCLSDYSEKTRGKITKANIYTLASDLEVLNKNSLPFKVRQEATLEEQPTKPTDPPK